MATRSTSNSEYYPTPPNYRLKSVGTVGNNQVKMAAIVVEDTDGVKKGGNVGSGSPTATTRTFSAKPSF